MRHAVTGLTEKYWRKIIMKMEKPELEIDMLESQDIITKSPGELPEDEW